MKNVTCKTTRGSKGVKRIHQNRANCIVQWTDFRPTDEGRDEAQFRECQIQHAVDAGLSPWCGKEFFCQSTFDVDSYNIHAAP